jgi:hypothetical protein
MGAVCSCQCLEESLTQRRLEKAEQWQMSLAISVTTSTLVATVPFVAQVLCRGSLGSHLIASIGGSSFGLIAAALPDRLHRARDRKPSAPVRLLSVKVGPHLSLLLQCWALLWWSESVDALQVKGQPISLPALTATTGPMPRPSNHLDLSSM